MTGHSILQKDGWADSPMEGGDAVMTAIDLFCCFYMIKQLKYDVWYLILKYKVHCYNKKDHSISK
jgi:hypothetical protein